MKKQIYVVTSITEDKIFVTHKDSFSEQTNKTHANLEVINPKRYPLFEGSEVYIGLPQRTEALNGILALFFPLISCVCALYASPSISRLISVPLTETFKAVCIIISFLISAAVVLFLSRSTQTIVKLQITSLA